MAEGDMDLGQLSTSQQEALDQYTQVTNQEISDAIPLLRRSEWNVQV
jgi:FAS-associated factor 2